MAAPIKLLELVAVFSDNQTDYTGPQFKEAQARIQFIDPLFELLGWDVSNKHGYAEAYKDVEHEDALKIEGKSKAPDYSFRIGGARKFFLEAKKPAVNVNDDVAAAYQLRRYGWSAKLPLSILTNFRQLAVYDCRVKPEQSDRASAARVKYYTFDEYAEKWDEIVAIFSKEAVLRGSFDRYAEDSRRKRGTAEVDDAFLEEIESWRAALAHNISKLNDGINVHQLNDAVQRTIDRIIFFRIAEDRSIEPYGQLFALKDKKDVYAELGSLFRKADNRYNSGLFHFKKGDGSSETLDTFTLSLKIDDRVLKKIIVSLYYPASPYEFSVLGADILGQVYEQFLGKTITLSGRRATIEEKPEVKKAGGVYYTPTYIVANIVRSTLTPLLEGKTPQQISGRDGRVRNPEPLRIIDPACGSGSFLIFAYQFLLDWYREQYVADVGGKHLSGKNATLYQARKGEFRLTIAEKRRVLLTHIFGVDVDAQATEVTKLSLLLKVLEGESGDVVASQMDLFKDRVLPDLGKNIKCGNSLISADFWSGVAPGLFDGEDRYRINTFDWKLEFPFLALESRFSAIIGNPPWISLTGRFRNEVYSKEERDYLIERYRGNTYMPNMYEYFVEKGLQLVAPQGRFGFIVPDRLGYNDQFVALRKRILENHTLETVIYRAPFPKVTADTLIFQILGSKAIAGSQVGIGEFGGPLSQVKQSKIAGEPRSRFLSPGHSDNAEVLEHIRRLPFCRPLGSVVATTSGFGGKSAAVTRTRVSARQMPVLKGESIQRFSVGREFYFEFLPINITGRTTDTTKLGAIPHLLIRKTGRSIIAAYDDTGRFPEQSLYFTYGPSAENEMYLLGILNSRLMDFIYFNTALTNRASIAQIKKVDLDELPIAIIDSDERRRGLADKVATHAVEIQSAMLHLSISKTEQERTAIARRITSVVTVIDTLVFDIYEVPTSARKMLTEWVAT